MLLALHAPAVAGQRAVVAYHAVAGNRDRQRIGGAGARHGARAGGQADAPRQFRIADGAAGGYLAQRLPDALLKGRAAYVERQVQAQGGHFDQADHPGHRLLVVRLGAAQVGLRKAVLQVVQQHFSIVAQQDGAHALVCAGDQERAERTGGNREADHGAAAAGAKGARRHAQQAWRGGIETAAGIETGRIQSIGDAATTRLDQAGLDPFATARRRVGFRRDAGMRLEDAVKMKAAHAGRLRQGIEVGHGVAGLDQAAALRDDGRLALGQRRLAGLAAQAGAKTGRFRRGATGVEGDIGAQGRARRARRAAVHAGAAHRIIKLAIGLAVALAHRVPAGFIVCIQLIHGALPFCSSLAAIVTRSDTGRTPGLAFEFEGRLRQGRRC